MIACWQWQLDVDCFGLLTELSHHAELCSAMSDGRVMCIILLHWFGKFVHRLQSKADLSTIAAAAKHKMHSPDFSKVSDKASSFCLQRARYAISSYQGSYEHGKKQGWCGPRQHL